MFYIVFRLLVNTLLISLTVLLLPGLQIPNASIIWYLIFGTIYGLMNTFVRPFVIFLTGRYVIRTLGLFMVVINSFMLVLLALLSPLDWDFNNVFTLLVAGAIIGVLSAISDAVLGLNRPVLDEIESGASYWRWFSKLPVGGRNTFVENMRFQQVYDTIWRYGLDISLAKTPLEPIREYIGHLFFPHAQTMDNVSAPVDPHPGGWAFPLFQRIVGTASAQRGGPCPAKHQRDVGELCRGQRREDRHHGCGGPMSGGQRRTGWSPAPGGDSGQQRPLRNARTLLDQADLFFSRNPGPGERLTALERMVGTEGKVWLLRPLGDTPGSAVPPLAAQDLQLYRRFGCPPSSKAGNPASPPACWNGGWAEKWWGRRCWFWNEQYRSRVSSILLTRSLHQARYSAHDTKYTILDTRFNSEKNGKTMSEDRLQKIMAAAGSLAVGLAKI